MRNALRDVAAEQFAMDRSSPPGLYLARRGSGDCVVVVLDFDAIEAQARGGRHHLRHRSRWLIVIMSQKGWRLLPRPGRSAGASLARGRYGAGDLPRPPRDARWPDPVSGEADPLLLVQTAADSTGWRVNLAQSTRHGVDAAVSGAGLAAMVVLGLGGLGLWLGQRSRRRRRHTAALENAVVERTADLRREIEERSAAEARAATLREGLRQANRLATLGQIAASVAHETAQPVAAIRTYAATSRQFLDMGEPDEVNRNLKAIDRLAERIGTVTAELRGFARKGGLAPGPVPLIEIIEGARLLLKERLSRVDFAQPVLPPGLMVLGDHVRLEQVLVNLLQNALEALDKEAAPHLDLAVQMDGEEVRVIVSDNGPGIAPEVADRLFTPFATSRPAGLGLGLVIAQDIATEFGGSLRLLPTQGGASFVVTLRRAA
jgi:two-component system C4-dicarboxylate transport sensor histidine kinase DctB